MKKGFVLMESIVVILIVTISLLTIFSSYNKILSKLREENKYDTTEYLYMTNQVKKIIQKYNLSPSIFNMKQPSSSTNILKEYKENDTYESLLDTYNVKKVYILSNINNLAKDNLKKFDGYIIDYIKKLDTSDEEILLIVEYQKPLLVSDTAYSCNNPDNNYLCDSKNNKLYETYIASLRWD